MMKLYIFLIFLFAILISAETAALECSPYQVDQALRSVTHSRGLLTVKKRDEKQSGSCFTQELEDFGITIIASSGENQARLDCEVVLFSGVEITNDWQLTEIKATALNSIQVSVISGAKIIGSQNLTIKPSILKDNPTVDNNNTYNIILLVWTNKSNFTGTLTIKSIAFNKGDCDDLRSSFRKIQN